MLRVCLLHSLDFHFFLVHAIVSTLENVFDAVAGLVDRHAVRDGITFPGLAGGVVARLLEFGFDILEQLVPILVITVLQQNDEFVSTESVNGGLLIYIAENMART